MDEEKAIKELKQGIIEDFEKRILQFYDLTGREVESVSLKKYGNEYPGQYSLDIILDGHSLCMKV